MSDNLAYREERREELINGQLVMMSPAATNHNRIANNLNRIFGNYLHGKTCEPFGDGEKVFLTKTDHYVPDFMVVCDPSKIKHDGVHGAPDLVVEILSPGTMRNDKTRKKEVYAKCGVQEYWLISPGDRSIEIFYADETEFVLHDIYTLRPDWELKQMTEEELAAVPTHFKCSLFDDLEISIEDIFYRTF